MESTIKGRAFRDNGEDGIYYYIGLYRDNGKENGNCYSGLRVQDLTEWLRKGLLCGSLGALVWLFLGCTGRLQGPWRLVAF